VRGLHQSVARGTGKRSRAARSAEAQQRHCRLGEANPRGGATPASSPRRCGAWKCQQAAQTSSSPPCEASGGLPDGRAATMEEISGGDAKLGFELGRRRGLGGKGFWALAQGRWPPLNRPGQLLGMRATPGKACVRRRRVRPGLESSPARGRREVGG
jgi:hypothetical protein